MTTRLLILATALVTWACVAHQAYRIVVDDLDFLEDNPLDRAMAIVLSVAISAVSLFLAGLLLAGLWFMWRWAVAG